LPSSHNQRNSRDLHTTWCMQLFRVRMSGEIFKRKEGKSRQRQLGSVKEEASTGQKWVGDRATCVPDTCSPSGTVLDPSPANYRPPVWDSDGTSPIPDKVLRSVPATSSEMGLVPSLSHTGGR
jgi:hypothetical protein